MSYEDYVIKLNEDNTEESSVTGTESLENKNTKEIKMSFKGNTQEEKNNPGTRLHVRTADNVVYRIYFCANTIIDSPYFQNRFCLFLDSLKPNQTAIIELGTGLGGSFPNAQLGMMISSIRNCKARVITIASGRCGFGESCLFIYGKDKIISPYGAIMFTGIKAYSDAWPMYVPYFTQIFKDALEQDIITQEHFDILINTGKNVMRTEKEFIIP